MPTLTPWKRHRFTTSEPDYRPVTFPPPGPWWISGWDSRDHAVIIAYLPSDVALTDFWPEAEGDDYTDEEAIVFTDRFPEPKWWTECQRGARPDA